MADSKTAPWDLEEARRLIAQVNGRSQLDLAAPCVRSLVDREFYARFHFQRAKACLRRYERKNLNSDHSMLALLGGDDAGWQKFNIVIRQLSADITACIQSIHSLPDILACSVYFSLALDRVAVPSGRQKVNHWFVLKTVAAMPEMEAVTRGLASVSEGDGFRHLAELANRSKHYSIVFPSLSADLTGERAERHALQIPAFTSRGAVFPQVYVGDFLPPIYEQVNRAVIATGKATLAELQRAAASKAGLNPSGDQGKGTR